ncbi:Transposon Ty3-I Gag-Pol polyprotein [Grifola frondosa]|uniref:Transposon Ty3-I Gag-Pol polyprotein n=1 Tax=Grifola frondosa TaxID=5627 RepID=A0A1C7LPD3_GRIFR|nr:Transposon Ty3-I Gag-Pol polyprotein [Grifola frondosa]
MAQPFLEHVAGATGGINLLMSLKDRYVEDKFFKDILNNPKHFKNFHINDGLVFIKDRQQELLCIPQILVNGRSAREIVITHAHSLLAHLGPYKTLGLLRDHVWWKTMSTDVQKYCDTCPTCRRSKPSNQKPYGLLNPLPIPSAPWEAIGMDFVGPLPESKNRDGSFDAITTVIDLLTGMVHLVPSRTNYNARQVAELVFAEVYKHHGLPRSIVSDRDVLFTSLFWTHLHKLIGVELRMSSAYHPQSDGSTERANRTIGQMLRQCIGPSQHDWVAKLPAIEFAINLARSDSTGYAPFFLNTGRMPRSMIWDHASADEYPGVRAYAQKVKYAVMTAHDSILAARVKQTRDANRRRRPAPFDVDDLVYISTTNISLPKGLARKLAPKFIGPYLITKNFGNNSYRIALPSDLKRRGIHDVFHASLLRIHEPNDDRLFPGRLASQVAELEDQDQEWAIDKFITHRGTGEKAVFEALWKSGDRTWVPYSSIAHLAALKAYFEVAGVRTIGELGEGTGKPPADDPQIYLGGLDIRPSGANFHRPPIKARRSARKSQGLLSTVPPATPMATLVHKYFHRLPDGDVVLRDPTTAVSHVFTPSQLLLFAAFDRELRARPFDPSTGLAPGGYESFQALWSNDGDCIYQFVFYDSTDATQLVAGEPIPIDLIVPDGIDASRVRSKYSAREERIMHGAMFSMIERQQQQDEFVAKKKAERLATKKMKALARMKDIAAGRVGGRGRPGGRGQRETAAAPVVQAAPAATTTAAAVPLEVTAPAVPPDTAMIMAPAPAAAEATSRTDAKAKKDRLEAIKRKFKARKIGADASVAATEGPEAGPSGQSSLPGEAVAAPGAEKDVEMEELVDL